MTPIIKIVCNEEKSNLSISYNDRQFDISRIADKKITEWAYPFCIKGVKWNGLYEELKAFINEAEYTVYFDGSSEDYDVLKTAFQDTPAKLVSTNNTVVILYSENPFTTRITVNGAVFDTTRIQNRSIDEWVNPICIRDLNWNGIFAELTEFIGIDVFTIQFSGKPEFMKTLIDVCPDNVDITYRSAAKPRTKAAKIPGENKAGNIGANIQNGVSNIASKVSLPSGAGQISDKLKQDVSDEEINSNLEKIPIKNDFVRKNAMAICAVLSLIMTMFPFVQFKAESDIVDIPVKIKGFQALFGDDNTLISISLFILPILIIVMNYIKQLKPYRRLIAIVTPCLSILFEIFTVIALKSGLNTAAESATAVGESLGMKVGYSTSLLIGFWLILISYILTAVVGYITYYGLELPNKKK